MATIDDLSNPNFSAMTEDELENLVRATRGRRANPPATLKKAAQKKAIDRKKKHEVKAKDEASITKKILELSPADRAAFLKQIQGE